ncbi:MAG: hypothetical protein J1F60_06715 [Oscillospiraceae bacterium]|nr:hypothetical protein [Oscillospiraceae bacterium]
MKIGTIKVKRNYQIAQMVLDAVAFIIFIVIVQCVLSFGTYISDMNESILKYNPNVVGLVEWRWNIVWIAVAVIVIAASLLMIYLPRKMPKNYIVNSDNAQKYSDIIITAITCVRIPVLLAVFEGMCIHQSILTGVTDGIITLQIPLDILFTAIIIRFSVHRIRLTQPKTEDKIIELKES